MNRLFQLHIKPAGLEEGTEVFELRQDIRTGEGSYTIAFDGGSDATLVTEAYAAKWKCKKLERQAAYVGFGQRVPKMGDVYEVVVADRLGKAVRLEAIAVPFIYGGPAAECPEGISEVYGVCTTKLRAEPVRSCNRYLHWSGQLAAAAAVCGCLLYTSPSPRD